MEKMQSDVGLYGFWKLTTISYAHLANGTESIPYVASMEAKNYPFIIGT